MAVVISPIWAEISCRSENCSKYFLRRIEAVVFRRLVFPKKALRRVFDRSYNGLTYRGFWVRISTSASKTFLGTIAWSRSNSGENALELETIEIIPIPKSWRYTETRNAMLLLACRDLYHMAYLDELVSSSLKSVIQQIRDEWSMERRVYSSISLYIHWSKLINSGRILTHAFASNTAHFFAFVMSCAVHCPHIS